MISAAIRKSIKSTAQAPALRSLRYASSTTEPDVLVERQGDVAFVTLNRPKALNALTTNMIRIMTKELIQLNSSPDVGLVVLRGAGGKAFCAGGDIKVLSSGKDGSPEARTAQEDFFREEYMLDHLIARSSALKPYVSLLDGVVMGGGFGVSIGAKMRIATDKTVFAMPETGIGLFPDVGGSYYLPRLPRALGMYLALTGNRINGAATTVAGLTTHYVPDAKYATVQEELGSCRSADNVLELLQSSASTGKALTEAAAGADTVQHSELIERTFAHNSVQDIMSELLAASRDTFHEDRAAWAGKQAKTLARVSPTSLAVTLAAQRAGKGLTLEQAFEQEFSAALNFMRGTDFYEGVRALLVDKDRSPKWTPDSIAAVQVSDVQQYFSLPAGVKPLKLFGLRDMVDLSGIEDNVPRM